MKTLTCWMLILTALLFFVTLGSQTIADEGDGTVVEDCEILRQVPQAICLTVEDGGPAADDCE